MFNKKLKQRIAELEKEKNAFSDNLFRSSKKIRELEIKVDASESENEELKILEARNKKEYSNMVYNYNTLVAKSNLINEKLEDAVKINRVITKKMNTYKYLYDMAEREYGKHFIMSHKLKEKILSEFGIK